MRKPDRRLRPTLDLGGRLKAAGDELGASAVDEVWIFPPLPNQEPPTEFVMLSCFDGAPERRRVVVARLTLEPLDEEGDEVRWVQKLEEHGTAPQDVIPRLAERLLRRAGDSNAPLVAEIRGAPERWSDFLGHVTNGTNGTP